MKIPGILLSCFLATLFSGSDCFATYFCYGSSGPIVLTVDSSMVALSFDSGVDPDSQQTLLQSIHRITGVVSDDHADVNFVICQLSTGVGYWAFMDSVQAVNGINLAEPYFRNSIDSPYVVGDNFAVVFNANVTHMQIDSINSVYKVVIDRELQNLPNTFILRNTDSSEMRVLDLANLYHELPETEYAYPVFGLWPKLNGYRLFDYYHVNQPHIKKVIGQFNVASVWDFGGIFTGSVEIAVVDEGVTSHEDLPASRVLLGYDYYNGDNNASPGAYRSHGMACAGIIGASQCVDSVEGLNTISGVISLNPDCNIIPIRVTDNRGSFTGMTGFDLANAIRGAANLGADVISNSWSYRFPCPPPDLPEFWALTSAISEAAYFGRHNRGCIIVFSAGNGFGAPVNFPGCVDPYDALAVGAVTLDDHRWDYSNYGSIDLVAPSGDICMRGDVWSLDQMGDLGNNPGSKYDPCESDPIYWNCGDPNNINYLCNFGGTSAAAPIVTGVASLILAYDSNLRKTQVFSIIRNSAVRDFGWKTITDPPDPEYGYGRVDAFRAILSIARGNIDNDPDKGIDVSDISVLIDYLYISQTPPFPSDLLGDVDCDGQVDISDLTVLIDYLYIDFTPLKGTPAHPCFNYGA